jgi:fructose-bisphosphate aldolase class II
MLLTMKDLLAVANKHYFAVPAFNISDYGMLNAVFDISKEKNAPLIIETHPNEIKLIGEEICKAIIEKANKAKFPVAFHLDHGANMEQILQAFRCGHTSVMIDGSHLPFEENIALCREVVKAAHPLGISVEGELGTIGSTDAQAEAGHDIIYTDPDDAVKFVEATGIDALAVAIGTSHGLYPKGFVPKLNLELLKVIKSKVSIPLVLHGGSDNPDNEINQSVKLGVNKINISSDIKLAFYQKLRELLTKDESIRTPYGVYQPTVDAVKAVAGHKIDLFLTAGKASLYSLGV